MSFAFQPRPWRRVRSSAALGGSRLHGLAWWLRLLVCHLLAGFGLVLCAGTAWAAPLPDAVNPSDEPAPMCDPDGASVAAGDEIPEIDRGHFDALPLDAIPCEAQRLLAGFRLDDPAFGGRAASFEEHESPPPGPQQLPRPRCEAIRELSVPFPERTEPALAMSDERDGLAPSRGHARSLFRPPVAGV